MRIDVPVAIQVPVLWGTNVFTHTDFGSVNFIVGPNGTGKTLFADQLRQQLQGRGIRTRYLSADRLSGLEKTAGQFWHNPFVQGFSFDQFSQYKSYGENAGLGADAFVILKERLDVRLRIEATLFQLFGRRMRLAEESGFLRPRLQRVDGGAEYQMREAEAHGLKELIVLLTFLYEGSAGCLIVDEPELHLHPQFQSLFIQEVRRVAGDPRADSSKKMFFLITHSPYIVDVRTIEDLQHCLVFQPGAVPRAIALSEPDDEWKLRRVLPRLNTHHKQFFFASRPVFVEGYQDQQLFTLMQERKGLMLGAAGASFIDVGGKEELDLFFRMCTRLGIAAHVIADLDALLEGKLRQSVIGDPRCRRYAAEQGLGSDLSNVLGQLEREASDLAERVREKLAGVGLSASVLKYVRQSLDTASQVADKTKGTRLARYTMLVAAQVCSEHLAALAPEVAERLPSLVGRLNRILEGFRQAGVHILRLGELENYLPTYTGNPFEVPNAAKADTFDAERELLLGDAVDAALVAGRYGELSTILDRATAGTAVVMDAQLNDTIGNWIHEIQMGVRRGMIKDLATLQSYASAEWGALSQILDALEFNAEAAHFSCRMRLQPTVDLGRREFTFSDADVPASFRLTPPSAPLAT